MIFRGSSRARSIRRGQSIAAYIGFNGFGKSLCMIGDTLPTLEGGDPVLSTVRLLDYRNPRPCEDDECGFPREHEKGHLAAHPLFVPFRDFRQLMEWENGDVLMDEVQGVASSREHQALPFQVASRFHELRRSDVSLRWSGVSWQRADSIVREATLSVTYCVGHMPKVRVLDGRERRWRDRRLFVWRTFDARAFDKWENKDRHELRAMCAEVFWRPGHSFERAYDSLAAVTKLGWANEAGMCVTCGGRRSVRPCECVPRPRRQRVTRGEGPPAGSEATEGDTPALVPVAESRHGSLVLLDTASVGVV